MTDLKRAQCYRQAAIELLDAASKLEGTPPALHLPERRYTCTCDACGCQVRGIRWIGERCESRIGTRYCTGRFRLDPERPETCRCDDGKIRLSEDAISEAAMHAAAESFMSDDDDPAEWEAFHLPGAVPRHPVRRSEPDHDLFAPEVGEVS